MTQGILCTDCDNAFSTHADWQEHYAAAHPHLNEELEETIAVFESFFDYEAAHGMLALAERVKEVGLEEEYERFLSYRPFHLESQLENLFV
jgi:hypothetical protein